MPIIYQKENFVTDVDPGDPTWKTWSVSEEYAKRLLAGARPESWDMLVLPDIPGFLELATNSAAWRHISQHVPAQAGNLFTALTARSDIDEKVLMTNIQGMMQLAVSALGAENALTTQQSLNTKADPDNPGQEIPVGTMADELDLWLEKCYFPFRYRDLTM